MVYWDSLREVQRLIDGLRPVEEEMRRLELVHQQLARPPILEQVNEILRARDRAWDAAVAPMRAQDLLDEFAKAQAALIQAPALFATAQLLEAAIRPIPDFRRIGADVDAMAAVRRFEADVGGMAALIERLSAGIAHASFLAELDLSKGTPEEDAEPTEDAISQNVESSLVKIASPDTIQALRSVQFAPIVLLDRALRNPELMRQMEARDFEGFIASLLDQLAFENVVLTPRSNDGGRDILAKKIVHGIPILFAFECKRYAANRRVGVNIARALLGTIQHGPTNATMGGLVTTSFFTRPARKFILTEPNLDGKDFDGIVEWLRFRATLDRTN